MTVLTVLLKRLPNNSDLNLPIRMTEDSAGFDLPAAVITPVILQPGEIRLIPCGFALAIPKGFEGQIRPRSGLSSKHGITLINSPGTIDSDYRGEIHCPVINLGKNPFTVERNMRIAQMLILPVPSVRLIEVDSLDETSRGAGGFGHTGH
ncbi:MAG TPA: dUTP diphosphatase [Tepidisphaeraceae bacterium]|nr:dUTP diphosphatase [Tepidisphaeraceae bacterium]